MPVHSSVGTRSNGVVWQRLIHVSIATKKFFHLSLSIQQRKNSTQKQNAPNLFCDKLTNTVSRPPKIEISDERERDQSTRVVTDILL